MKTHRAPGNWLAAILLLGVIWTGCGEQPSNPAATEQIDAGTGTSQPTAPPSMGDWAQAIRAHATKHALASHQGTPYRLSHFPTQASDPRPIPGGLAPGLHAFVPGPAALGLMGEDVEPSTITDFKGFSAIAYMAGTAVGSDGKTFDMLHDMRLFSGKYIAEDGTRRRGNFALI